MRHHGGLGLPANREQGRTTHRASRREFLLQFSMLSNRSFLSLAAAAVTVGASSFASAATIGSTPAPTGPITIQVIPTLAPNVFGSPSFAPWQANAITALDTGT